AHRQLPPFPYTTLFRSVQDGAMRLSCFARNGGRRGKKVVSAPLRQASQAKRLDARSRIRRGRAGTAPVRKGQPPTAPDEGLCARSEEHTSELQSRENLV